MYQRSYHAKVLSKKAPPEKKRPRRLPWRRIAWLVGVVVAAGMLVFLIRWPRLQVRHIEVVGTSVADPEEIALFLRSQIEGNVLYVFPKSSMLLVPTTSLVKWTARAFPRFERVDVRRKGLRDLLVTVVEHEGKYLWCEAEHSCFFMTDGGIVFAEAPFFSGDAYPKIFIGEKAALPFSPLTDAERSIIALFLERLPAIGIYPTEFHAVSAHQLDIHFWHYGAVARILVDPESDIHAAIEDLATGLMAEPLKSLFHDEGKALEYLDIRFANKVVYKFQ